MNLQEAERWLPEQLRAIYDNGERAAIAAWVFEKVTGWSRSERAVRKNEPLGAEQAQQLAAFVQRLQAHEPVQYVLGEAHFQGLNLYVDSSVLIPRPETEELVEWIIGDAKAAGKDVFEKREGEADKTRSLKILDVGTGSGCIALALKKGLPKAEVWGCDKSDAALNIARRNGAALNIRVDFQSVDFLDEAQWASLPMIDILVSNPPYIPQNERHTMQPNVVQYEPHSALFVPDGNPLIFYEALAAFGKKKLHAAGAVYVEVHEERGDAVAQLFQKATYQNVELKKDMQGKARMVKALTSNK